MSDDQIVNHLRGSQHLSNKALLAYHMATARCETHMPMQWSASYQDLAELVGMALLSTLYGCCLVLEEDQKLDKEECGADQGRQARLRSTLQDCVQVQRALLMDTEWASSTCSDMVRLLVACLSDAATEPVSIKSNSVLSALSTARATVEAQSGCRSCYGCEDTWIVKPVGLSCGEDITLCRGLRGLLAQVGIMNHKCVVQRYVERPLLVRERRKFDIRQWVLVTSVEPVVVHGFSEFYARLSGKPYELTGDSLGDKVVHLCNNAVQAEAKGYRDHLGESRSADRKTEVDSEDFCNTMMSMAQLQADLDQQGRDGGHVIATIMSKIKRICVDTILNVRDKLQRIGSGFEWLGFDFMVTEDLDVLMLECNVSPDVSHSTGITSRLVTRGVGELFPLLLGEPTLQESDGGQPSSWEQWHPATATATATAIMQPSESKDTQDLSVLQFARMKREQGILRSGDYSPQKLHVLQRVNAILAGQKMQYAGSGDCKYNNYDDEEGDDDEI